MWRLFNFYFGYDYVAWANVADNGIARVHVDGLGRVFYWRYKSTRVADIIVEPSQVIWLTCSPNKYFGSGTDGSPTEKRSGAKNGWGEAVNSNDVLGGYARNCNEQRKRTRS